jgi:hypothetical protein
MLPARWMAHVHCHAVSLLLDGWQIPCYNKGCVCWLRLQTTSDWILDPTSILYIEKKFDLFLMWCIDMQINSSLPWFHPVWCASFLAKFRTYPE